MTYYVPLSSLPPVLKFTGHEFDDLGTVYSTYYMHARSATATVGRFLSVDPERIAGDREGRRRWP
jgi:hypothetical protein